MQALAQPYVGALDRAFPAVVNMQRSYDRYYATGLYASRYPTPNPHILNLVLSELGPMGGRVLDFGCGSGRYALPLAQRPGVSVLGYDISAAAIQELGRNREAVVRCGAPPMQLETLCGSFDDLERRLDGDEGFDLVVLLFGVLGHVERRARRVAVLRSLSAHLRPGGRLIATVPNRARRFLAEQEIAQALGDDGGEEGDIRYRRGGSDNPIDLYYHLYSPAEFRGELAAAGLAVASLRPESVLTERMVLSSRLGAATDRVLRRTLPVSLAYGLVAVAEAAPAAAR